MNSGVVNKSTTVNTFVLHILQRYITHLAVITRKTNIKLGTLKGGNWKRAQFLNSFISKLYKGVGNWKRATKILRMMKTEIFRPEKTGEGFKLKNQILERVYFR